MTTPARTLFFLSLALTGRTTMAADAPGQVIEVRVLEPGGRRRVLAQVDLDRLRQSEARRYDPQYDAVAWLRGVALTDVLAAVEVPAEVDLALLRFDNGLQIPL